MASEGFLLVLMKPARGFFRWSQSFFCACVRGGGVIKFQLRFLCSWRSHSNAQYECWCCWWWYHAFCNDLRIVLWIVLDLSLSLYWILVTTQTSGDTAAALYLSILLHIYYSVKVVFRQCASRFGCLQKQNESISMYPWTVQQQCIICTGDFSYGAIRMAVPRWSECRKTPWSDTFATGATWRGWCTPTTSTREYCFLLIFDFFFYFSICPSPNY